ncbi:GH1 family beta-glucosidase [Spirochaeta isovalerica]|uniref:Beta-glucosidase n=1 Tax=Spirochaeta isovalerica TaxID=150 RepID=A0A841RD76_9SPIO|nr:GH1 family beta-glucosidase [Spirochaeta isovalerica]MBB6480598.1 beta-glucosidase [Spirochaeta isovalerica]
MSFKKDFIWGAAAASYQIEGAWNEDGKGMSIWDHFTEKNGAVYQGHTGKIACDHYHRYKEDVAIMKELGLQSYRFSISWPRILPSGTGKISEKGLDFYSRLVDELLAADIIPFPTLFHWDYPYELYCRGGWLNPAASDWFAEYTSAVVDKIGDRVDRWFTLNEPQVFIEMGHMTGEHAPGVKLQLRDRVRMIHNVLLSHGKAVQVLREKGKENTKIGMAPVCGVVIPADDSEKSIKAAREHMFSSYTEESFNAWSNSWWLDPVFFGKYPEESLKHLGKYLPEGWVDDMATIARPLDFLGNNHYHGSYVTANEEGKAVHKSPVTGEPVTGFNWRITPEGIYWGSKFLFERYKKPIIITENGLSNKDWVSLDGKVHDPQRIDFTHRYLKEYKKAAEEGVELLGYFHWSIMDNFEWAAGYRERFGMVHVDYATQKRTIKDSGYWYRDVIKSHGENL